MHDYEKLKGMLCDELEQITRKGELTAGSLDTVDKLTHAIKSVVTIMAMADEEECHDIVNGVFEEVWRHIDQIDHSTAKSFLYASVRNRCIDYVRRMKLRQQYVEFTELMSERYIQADEQIEQQDIKKRISEILNALKPPTKEILEACYIQGKKYKEVAEEMKISISTVKKHMVRALRILRDLKNAKSVT